MNLNKKRILVTGADGFIGSHLAEQLVQLGAGVKALTLYNSFGSWGWLDSSFYSKDMEIIAGDIRDPFLCGEITKKVDIIFNLAALIAIPYSYIAPSSYVETNVNGALNICQAALKNSVSRLIQISTSEVYGSAKYVPIDENHPLQPQSPYSASKIGADALAMSHYYSYKLPVVIARPFNTYGPRQSARAVIPTILTQLYSEQGIIKLGSLTPTRDFNYVTDTCNGLIALSECDAATGKAVNIGSNYEISIGDVANKIMEFTGIDCEIVTDTTRLRPVESEVDRLMCDNSLLKELTGFTPSYCIDRGLKETINWFINSSNSSKYKGNIYNV